MTHLPFIAAAYALSLLLPAGLVAAAWRRLRRARRRLGTLDPRAHR
jgi:hypothetical protein